MIDTKLENLIEEFFGSFIRKHGFKYVANDMPKGWSADRVAFYEGPEYRLIFERDQMNTIGVSVGSLTNRQRAVALDYLLQFLSGKVEPRYASLQEQSEGLVREHAQIGGIIGGRNEDLYKAFLTWVDANWPKLKR